MKNTPYYGMRRLHVCYYTKHVLPRQLNREILLWPNGAPGSEGKTGNEKKPRNKTRSK